MPSRYLDHLFTGSLPFTTLASTSIPPLPQQFHIFSKMTPSTSHISSQLRQMVYYHLDNNLVQNALFLAGRLHAYEPRTSEASYLLALCYLQSGQGKAAWETSRNFGSRGTHLGCSYVYAQSCLDLGKYMDGINALERSKSLWSSRNHWSKQITLDCDRT